jgi:HAE1 family hydrophobic/amphiphilic exporter-1
MGKLASLAVRFRVTFLMIYILVVGAGLFFLGGLKLDMYPDITFPVIGVVTTYTGAAPEDIEQLITRTVEEACASVEGVKHINSDSTAGASLVFVEFEWGTDIDQAEIDIRRNLDFYREILPVDAQEPISFPFDPSMQPILFFGVSGPYDQARLREISTREIEPYLERVVGVASAETLGGLEREIHVEVLPQRLAAAGISVNQVVGALRMENVDIPGGEVVHGLRELSIQPHGSFREVEEIRDIIVGVAGGVPIRLRDVARVRDTVAEETRIIRANQRQAIMLMVRKQSGANTVQTVAAVENILPDLEQRLPTGIRLQPIFNQADFINLALGNLSTTGLLAILMAVVVLLFFLRSPRAALIVGLAMPTSILVTFTVMYAIDLTLNVISMAGLALAVGMLVDNSIVVLENIYRHMELGKSAARASVDGAQEVARAIFGSTLTTIAVFLPILFVPGLAGAMFRDMAMTICISLGASFAVAITLIPLAASVFIKKGQKAEISTLANGYAAMQRVSLRWRALTVITAVLALFGSVGFIVWNYMRGNSEFLPKEDSGIALFSIQTQVGSSVEHLDRLGAVAEKLVAENVPEVELLAIDIGVGEGFAAMFSEGKHAGLMRVRLVPLDQRERRQWQIEDQIRKLLSAIPGLEAKVFQPFMMSSDEGDLVIKIRGHDIATARRVGREVKSLIEGIDGAKDVSFSLEAARPELHVIYDRPRMSRLGLTSAEVTSSVSAFFQGTIATIFREDGRDYNVRVRAPLEFRHDPDNLEDMIVVSPIAGPVVLRSVARLEEQAGPVKITREDQRRVVTVSANSLPGKLGGLTAAAEERLEAYRWPEGFDYKIGGAAEDMQESFMYLGLAVIASMLLVYMVMASLFESLLTPFVIGFTIPLGMIGVGLALFVTGTALSITAAIGLVVLVGIVVNNSIMLVDYTNQLCAGGMERLEAVALAGRQRVRPILMTTMTTVLAMFPMALEIGTGAESWSPLARVIIGGLLGAMLITLFVVPVIYMKLGGGGAASAERLSAAP